MRCERASITPVGERRAPIRGVDRPYRAGSWLGRRRAAVARPCSPSGEARSWSTSIERRHPRNRTHPSWQRAGWSRLAPRLTPTCWRWSAQDCRGPCREKRTAASPQKAIDHARAGHVGQRRGVVQRIRRAAGGRDRLVVADGKLDAVDDAATVVHARARRERSSLGTLMVIVSVGEAVGGHRFSFGFGVPSRVGPPAAAFANVFVAPNWGTKFELIFKKITCPRFDECRQAL